AELANLYQRGDVKEMWDVARETHLTFNLVTFVLCSVAVVIAAWSYVLTRSRPVYLMHYECYRPPAELGVSEEFFMEHSRSAGVFSEENLEFQLKVLSRSGLGQHTSLPPAIMSNPPEISMATAREEAHMVLFDVVERTLAATRTPAQAIDILIVNCSLFNPTPSLSAMLVNRFKMRSDVVTYNLSGMGCSAGVIAIGLARQMLQLHPGSRVLVVSTENITQNWYFGNERSMLVPNCLFRMGGAAMLLSNRARDRWRARYALKHVVRTHMGQDDAHYGCVYQREDADGKVGVHLSKDLMRIAGHALKANITTLGPLVLPLSEQVLFFANLVARRFLGLRKSLQPYIPDFKQAFEHFCIHTGGRGVIDAIEQQLQLGDANVEASRQSLEWYGNVSSASIWYVLANIETLRGVRKGDRVWQIAFGSGFKCNSAVWVALRDVNYKHSVWSHLLGSAKKRV
ncbi:FAE1/Type III polyketide synthase-like protein, partial [Helicosporidium sp. ATCC 50920]